MEIFLNMFYRFTNDERGRRVLVTQAAEMRKIMHQQEEALSSQVEAKLHRFSQGIQKVTYFRSTKIALVSY